MNINFKEKKLLLAFAFLILLTLLIGLVGIFQIQGLSHRIEDLGKHHLRLEGAVLEMRIKNANYAMGIRNYVFWRTSRYQGAVPMTVYVNRIVEAGEDFKNQLEIYRQSANSDRQKEWGNLVTALFDELFSLGNKIIASADKEASGRISEATNDLLMSFGNRVYEIDKFLDNSMGKSNLQEIQQQVSLAKMDKDHAIFFLQFNLAGALFMGTLIVVSVTRRRIQERAYRQQLFNHMVNVEEIERKKLSTAVHDEMGQALSALKIYLGLIGQQSERSSDDLKSKVDECRKITASLIDKSHNIAFLLRPPDLDEVGLVDSLEALLLECKHLTNASYRYEKPLRAFELSPEYSLLFYRIGQELLTNMAKHAQAKHVELKLSRKNASVELFYSDDGRGFDYNEVMKHPSRRSEDKLRLGLLGLKERVELLDGKMKIDSAHGQGTNIVVQLPV